MAAVGQARTGRYDPDPLKSTGDGDGGEREASFLNLNARGGAGGRADKCLGCSQR